MNNGLKIQYLTFNDPYVSSGVNKKEKDFCDLMGEHCRKMGIEFRGVNVFTPERANGKSLLDSCYFSYKNAEDSLCRFFGKTRFIRALFRIRPMLNAVYEEVRQFDPDMILWRYDTINVPGLFNPKRVKPGVIFITEHQTKEMEELASSLAGKIKIPLLWCYERSAFQNIDAVVGVTTEIAKYEQGKIKKNIPVYVHTNGINVKACSKSQYMPFNGDVLRLVFVGSATAPWHGMDRLLRGIARYNGNVRIELHMAGFITKDIRKLITSLDLSEKTIFHGVCYGKDLDTIINLGHIAVGTLGIHRQNLRYGSPLKVREYMARGVPFFFSYIDEDIKDDFPLCLRIPPDESPVDIHKIVAFMEHIHNKYGDKIPDIMRNYALKHMDYEDKVSRLIDFLLSLARIERGDVVL